MPNDPLTFDAAIAKNPGGMTTALRVAEGLAGICDHARDERS